MRLFTATTFVSAFLLKTAIIRKLSKEEPCFATLMDTKGYGEVDLMENYSSLNTEIIKNHGARWLGHVCINNKIIPKLILDTT